MTNQLTIIVSKLLTDQNIVLISPNSNPQIPFGPFKNVCFEKLLTTLNDKKTCISNQNMLFMIVNLFYLPDSCLKKLIKNQERIDVFKCCRLKDPYAHFFKRKNKNNCTAVRVGKWSFHPASPSPSPFRKMSLN